MEPGRPVRRLQALGQRPRVCGVRARRIPGDEGDDGVRVSVREMMIPAARGKRGPDAYSPVLTPLAASGRHGHDNRNDPEPPRHPRRG
ncbi:hypothetical protein EMIT0158MI4_150085 [Burkholderia ambifaria]